jgi:hypothetical protein
MSYLSARELVMTYGWNTTAYQILNPGLRHWFAPDVPDGNPVDYRWPASHRRLVLGAGIKLFQGVVTQPHRIHHAGA